MPLLIFDYISRCFSALCIFAFLFLILWQNIIVIRTRRYWAVDWWPRVYYWRADSGARSYGGAESGGRSCGVADSGCTRCGKADSPHVHHWHPQSWLNYSLLKNLGYELLQRKLYLPLQCQTLWKIKSNVLASSLSDSRSAPHFPNLSPILFLQHFYFHATVRQSSGKHVSLTPCLLAHHSAKLALNGFLTPDLQDSTRLIFASNASWFCHFITLYYNLGLMYVYHQTISKSCFVPGLANLDRIQIKVPLWTDNPDWIASVKGGSQSLSISFNDVPKLQWTENASFLTGMWQLILIAIEL